MRKLILLAIVVCCAAGVPAAQDLTTAERETLRDRIEGRFDVVPLTDAVALRPKTRRGDIRLIEVAETIMINGIVVSGRELRERLGADADLVLRLSYLDAAARQALFARPAAPPPPQPDLERPAGARAPVPSPSLPSLDRGRRSRGDRVRVMGDISIPADETVSGQVVAVMGSVRVDGEVTDQVVAVLGSVDLGPKAIVRGDIVTVGGRIRRAEGAQVRGTVTEVALGVPNGVHITPLIGVPWVVDVFDGFGAVPRLVGSTFRFLLLALLAAVAFVVARPTVESAARRVSDAPVTTTLVGVLSAVFIGPLLFLISVVLAISIIGLPLLLLVPFVMVLLLAMALAGFTGTAYALGQAVRRRFGVGGSSPLLEVTLGVLLILLPVLAGRVIALGGWPTGPIVWLLIAVGLGIEFLAWSSGFGAVLSNATARWQARRTPPPPPATVSAP